MTLLSAIVTLFAEKIQNLLLKNQSHLWTLAIMTALEGATLILAAKTKNLFISYLGYILFNILYAFTICLCSSGLAKRLTKDTFGLIFGINTFLALIFQTLLTIIVVSGDVLHIGVIEQFIIYAGIYFVFAAIYLINIVYDRIKNKI